MPRLSSCRRAGRERRGVSLVEMLIASTVVSVLVGGLGLMALGVRRSQDASQDQNLAAQHARVILERMERNLRSSHANLKFPGFVVFSTQVGAFTFPDVLVVWKPSTTPANPSDMPLWSELIIYATDVADAGRLLEITMPNDTASAPELTAANMPAWTQKIADARAGTGSQRVLLSDRVRLATPSAPGGTPRAALRFDTMLRPTAAEWDAYVASTATWESLKWVQDVYGSQHGLRQNVCQIELQMRAGARHAADTALPFLGSAAVYFQVSRP